MLKIKEIRELKNLTQNDLVNLSGIKKRSFVDYESGKTDIPFSKLQKIASSLNVTIAELCGEVEYNTTANNSNSSQSELKKNIELKPIEVDLEVDPETTPDLEFYKKLAEVSSDTANKALNQVDELTKMLTGSLNEIEKLHLVIKKLETKLSKYENETNVG